MPLPPSTDREQLHVRTIDMRGYRRPDGMYEIEGHITDVKNLPMQPPGRDAPMPPGVPIHDMSVRLVVDEHLVISDVVVAIDSGPYGDCKDATESLSVLKGARIGAGWTKRAKELLGAESCTHVVELLIPLATAAYQTLAPVSFTRPDRLDASGRPVRIDSCYSYGGNRALVMKRWPAHYTGSAPKPGGAGK